MNKHLKFFLSAQMVNMIKQEIYYRSREQKKEKKIFLPMQIVHYKQVVKNPLWVSLT
jgi:hypothetical protein